jgi:hypothetical protein
VAFIGWGRKLMHQAMVASGGSIDGRSVTGRGSSSAGQPKGEPVAQLL